MVTGLMARIGERDVQIVQRDKTIASKDRKINYRQAKIDQLTREMAVLKRLASSDAAVSNSTRPKPVCSMRPLMLTSQPSNWNSSIWHLRHQQTLRSASCPDAQRCRQSCPASTSTTNPNPPPAPQQAAAAA